LKKTSICSAAPVQIGHAGASPFQMVGQKNHLAFLALDFDQGGHAAQGLGVSLAGGVQGHFHDLVAQDPASDPTTFQHTVWHLFLGPGDPKEAALVQSVETAKVDIGFVENHDLSGPDFRAEPRQPTAVILVGRPHHHVRAILSTPVSRAKPDTKCAGINLQTCPSVENTFDLEVEIVFILFS
jgi:hypothetical protein